MTAGIIFEVEAGGVRVRATRRADLARNRMEQVAIRVRDLDRVKREAQRRGKPITRVIEQPIAGVVETPSYDGAKKLRRVMLRAFAKPGSGDLVEHRRVRDALLACNRFGQGLKVFSPEPPKPEDRSKLVQRPTIDRRHVPDPSMSAAEKLEQLDRFPNSRWTGWTKADVNLSTMIGGLARVRGKTEAQVQGATQFRNLAERALIGGAKAVDYSKARVDSSGPTENAEIEGTEDARRRYNAAVDRLGGPGSSRHVVAEMVIVHGKSIQQVAEDLGMGTGGAAREKITAEALAAADDLAKEFCYASDRTSRATTRGWSDGGIQAVFTSSRAKVA